MALHGLIFANGLSPELSNFAIAGLTARTAELSSFPQVIARQTNSTSSNSTSSVPSVNLFIDSAGANAEYVASIVSACSTETVYAARCTKAPTNLSGVQSIAFNRANCGPNAPAVTFTEGPSTYKVATSVDTSIAGFSGKASITENCALAGTTAATCNVYFSVSASGTSTTTSTVIVATGSIYARYQVPITAGASNTASPGICPTTGGAAAAINTKAAMAWGLAGVAGVAGLIV